MSLLRRAALLRGHLWRDFKALGGPLPAVPQKRVSTREKVTTLVAEVDDEGVRLREIAVTFVVLKVLEFFVWAETALNLLDGPTCEVGLRSLEERSVAWLEFLGDLEKLVCRFLFLFLLCFADMMRCFLINTFLDPSQLPIRSFHDPTPLEAWSQQGLMADALRTRGREPLRSASRRLGCAIHLFLGSPGHQLVVGPGSGSRCLQNSHGCSAGPNSLLGRNFMSMCPHQIALRLLYLTVAFPEGHSGCECRCHI